VSAYQLWVAADGSWGGGEVVVIETTDWTADEIDAAGSRLDEARDRDRLEVAQQIVAERAAR
jgi:hypothetical protein